MIGSQLNHYEILDKLGTGGMGEVFVAEDTRLNRKVAIKILPEDLAADPERRERFEREAKTIAALNHPNIVTIYSVEEADGLHFITMELVEGKQLNELLPESGLPLSEFFKLAVPMVDALDAAHKKGITHRDIKPGNVMVTEEGRVKVLDFGLAKLARAEAAVDEAEAATVIASSDLTEQGQILGTVNYMSPEQAEGKVVDQRSDIFSLGVLMYEMATGEAPFKGDTKISVITSIMRDTPPPVTEINNELPQHLGRVLNRSLAKDPGRRYQTATDLRNELEDLEQEIATSELRQSAMKLKPEPIPGGNGLKYAGMAAVVLALFGLAYFFWPPSTDAPPPPVPPALAVVDEKPSLAVLYFENLSGDDNLDWLRTGLTDLLVTDLAQSPHIRVLGTDRLHQILEDIGAADDDMTSSSVVAAVADQGQVESVLLGSFARVGNLIRISARLQSASSGEIIASEAVEGEGEEAIFGLVDELTRRIKAQFDMADEMMAADVDADLTDVTTESLEAFRYYAEGVRLHEELREEEAIPLLERAVEADPDFAMALAKLAVAYQNIGDIEAAQSYSERAMDHIDNVTDRERYYIEGRHYSMEQETMEQSIAAYEKAVELYPDHTAARNNLAQQLMNLERFDEAIRHLEVLRRGGMQFPGTYSSLATAYGQTGRLEEGLEVLRQYTRENPDNAAGFANLAGQLAWAGRYDEARQALDDSETLGRAATDTLPLRWQIAVMEGNFARVESLVDEMLETDDLLVRGNGLMMAAAYALFEGDLDDAYGYLDDAEQTSNMRSQSMIVRANVLLDVGDFDGALAFADRQLAAAGDDAQVRLESLAGRGLAIAARDGIAAAAGTVDELWNLVEGLGLPEAIIVREETRYRGQLAFHGGDWEEAISRLSDALAQMPSQAALGNGQRARIHYLLGVSAYELGRLDDAAEHFARVLATPGRVYEPFAAVRSHWFLGQIQEAGGDLAGAREHYAQFVERWASGDIDEDRVDYAEAFLER